MLTFTHCLRVEDPQLREDLWELAQRIFVPLCEQTPINQFYPREMFLDFLLNEDVIKCLEFSDGTLCGFGLATEKIELEPLLNPYYFEKHYPGVHALLVMLVGVHPDFRKGDAGPQLYRQIVSYMRSDGIGVYVHSEDINQNIPRLMNIIFRNTMSTERLDAEVCWLHRFTKERGIPTRYREDLVAEPVEV